MLEFLAGLYPEYDPSGAAPLLPVDFAPPNGSFLVLRLDGAPLACGGLRRSGSHHGAAELKRLYVRASARGAGLGRVLLGALEARAAELGYGQVWLETGPRQEAAIRLYESSGYEPIPSYSGSSDARSYAKKLARDRRGALRPPTAGRGPSA